MALTKKSLDNFLPNGFETQNKKDYKANFTPDRILTGYDKDTLEVLSGPNLNNLIDVTGKNFNTLNDLLKYFNDMPIDSFPIVNASNQLDYKSINSFFRNVGELVFSQVPIEDKNLKLLDGAILDGTGTYRVFVSFISKMVEKYPSLFLTEAEWQAQVNKYGICGKFVWNAEKNTLRIPKVSGIIEATLDPSSIGNVVEAGLPNITGSFFNTNEWESSLPKDPTGAFKRTRQEGNGADGGHGWFETMDFNAARSNAIYGKSNTVQPQTLKEYIYMVVSVDTEETQKLTSVFQYRGSVPTFDALPKEGNLTGDVWNVEDTDINYVWDGKEWDKLSGTVDLTGYYTKDECDIKFAEQTSLASHVEKLQGQITQNKTDISIISSGETIQSAVEQMKGSKFLENKAAVGTYANVYNDIKKYYHSTFDKSKFTIVGNPTISDNGVASGFSASNYLKVKNLDVKRSDVNIKLNIQTGSIGSVQYILGDDSLTTLTLGIWENRFFFWGNSNARFDIPNSIIPILANTKYKIDIILKNLDLKIYINDVLCLNKQIDNVLDNFNCIGTGSNKDRFFKGSIDLKQFSISVDDKEVFSGHKTGIDVIKPDNFTKVGNPVISDDGVASGFSNSNYLETISIDRSKPFKQIVEYTPITNENSGGIYSEKINTTFFSRLINTNGNKLVMLLTSDGNGWNIGKIYSDISLELGKSYIIEFGYTGIKYYLKIYKNNILLETKEFSSELKMRNLPIIIGKQALVPATGSIDLNALKIYVDGNLVYQPMLRVPYHETAQGFKIAPAETRTRIVGMYEDYGYSQYFTIDEDNKNYTLPCGANPSGRQDLISSFDDGTNKVEQFSDLTVKQSGNCTANQPVVLMKPYRDDKYKISVPYSSKTKTGFTPTQNGNWFAEGKIYLD